MPINRSLLYRLSHLKLHRLPRAKRPTWRPFIAPFVRQESDVEHSVVHVTPRLVAYFEVSILPTGEYLTTSHNNTRVGQNQVDDNPNQQYHRARNERARAALECVAVGLATNGFHLQGRMPGWDNDSYGNQGDDGGIFHVGHMLRVHGLPFGIGDTVGCGLDNQHHCIVQMK